METQYFTHNQDIENDGDYPEDSSCKVCYLLIVEFCLESILLDVKFYLCNDPLTSYPYNKKYTESYEIGHSVLLYEGKYILDTSNEHIRFEE